MQLAELVHEETGTPAEQIMLLRHFNEIDNLIAAGGSVEEFTSLQPIASKWDFEEHGISVVVVIVHDIVTGVYGVLGVEDEDTVYGLADDAHRRFDIERGHGDKPARRFNMQKFDSRADNARITGWKGKEVATPLRSHMPLFWDIGVTLPIFAEDRDFTLAELDAAACGGYLGFRNIPTSNRVAVVRQRVGQDIVRKWTLKNYGGLCALCDISDDGLLRASHIKGWAECEESRGALSNVICLCGSHDALFENGYWSLDDNFCVVLRAGIKSKTILSLLPTGCAFRKPAIPPELSFLRYHRAKHRL